MSDLDRREFIAFVGKACAGTAALRGLTSAEPASGAENRERQKAESSLARRASGRAIYRGTHLANVSLPLGGLGAGSVALTGRGSLRAWQIFNACNPQALLPGSFFAIRAEPEGGQVVSKVLQTDPIGKLPLINDTEFGGEYPFGWLTYKDAQLPVLVRLEAYSPCIPMNVKDSGLPGAVFRFRVKNPGRKAVRVSLAGTCQNGVGFDGFGSFDEAAGLVNRYEQRDGVHTLVMTAQKAQAESGFDAPVVIFTESRQAARLLRYFRNAEVRFHESLADIPDGIPTRATATLAAQRGTPPPNVRLTKNAAFEVPDAPVVAVVNEINAARNFPALETFVAEGGVLVVLGPSRELFASVIAPDKDDSAILYEDFEGKNYDAAKWTVEGEAFGSGPAHGTFPGQQTVSGFQGGGLVNSWNGTDDKTGRMTSKPFALSRRYIHFLLGGGDHPNQSCFNLRVDGKIVRTATGRNEEKLRAEKWDVGEFAGQQAMLEIVDTRRDGWGHINLDQIVFSDAPLPPDALTPELKKRIRDFLPFTFTAVNDLPPVSKGKGAANNDAATVQEGAGVYRPALALQALTPKPDGATNQGRGYEAGDADEAGNPLIALWKYGKGDVSLLLAPFEGAGGASAGAKDRREMLGKLISIRDDVYAKWFHESMAETHPLWGSMSLATDAPDATFLPAWDNLDGFWQTWSATGRLNSPTAEPGTPASLPAPPAPPGATQNAALAAHVSLKPGEEREIVFWLSWHFPNRYRDRPQDVGFGSSVGEYEAKYRLGNRYNNWFGSAADVTDYLRHHDARLYGETKRFQKTLFDGTLPYVIREAVSANIAILRSPTSMWLEDGSWMAYEGLGCCPMNCTHVYNYSQTLAHLWPELERSAREIDLTIQLQEDGGVRHRTQLPLDGPRFTGPFTDGHCSTISKAYREHRQSKDKAFLTRHWSGIKKATEYAIREYDKNGDGVIEGRQPNTYDCDVYGPNSFITTQYLAALRASERMAREMGENDTAERYRALHESGSRHLDAMCWNGDYYQQNFPDYATTPTQYGPGCLSDQLLGQWWAHVNGLGHLLPSERVKAAMQAVVRHNFIPDFTGYDYQGWRVFADRKDAGLIICSWPKGGKPKATPLLYHSEVFTGVEYQVAAHLLYEGLADEALKILIALRARYDGTRRNPFDEVECSTFYGRAMASWSVLLAASGYEYHGPSGFLAFAPRLNPDDFRAFFTTSEGWGTFAQTRTKPSKPTGKGRALQLQTQSLALAYGSATLKTLQFALAAAPKSRAVEVVAIWNKHRLPCKVELAANSPNLRVTFPRPITLKANQTLTISIQV